jgi:hypothetical protein
MSTTPIDVLGLLATSREGHAQLRERLDAGDLY